MRIFNGSVLSVTQDEVESSEIQDHRFMVGFLAGDTSYRHQIPNGFKDKLLHSTFLWPSLDQE